MADDCPRPALLSHAAVGALLCGTALFVVSVAVLGGQVDGRAEWVYCCWAASLGLITLPTSLTEGLRSSRRARTGAVDAAQAGGIWVLGAVLGVLVWHQLTYLPGLGGVLSLQEAVAAAVPASLVECLNVYVWAGSPSVAFGAGAYARLRRSSLRTQLLLVPVVTASVTVPAWALVGAHPQALAVPLAAAWTVPLALASADRLTR